MHRIAPLFRRCRVLSLPPLEGAVDAGVRRVLGAVGAVEVPRSPVAQVLELRLQRAVLLRRPLLQRGQRLARHQLLEHVRRRNPRLGND